MKPQRQVSAIFGAMESSQPDVAICSVPLLLFSEDIARITGLSVTTIRHYTGNAEKFGHMLPQWFKLSGSRRLVWLPDVVAEWIEHAQSTAKRPRRQRGRPTKAEQIAHSERQQIELGADR